MDNVVRSSWIHYPGVSKGCIWYFWSNRREKLTWHLLASKNLIVQDLLYWLLLITFAILSASLFDESGRSEYSLHVYIFAFPFYTFLNWFLRDSKEKRKVPSSAWWTAVFWVDSMALSLTWPSGKYSLVWPLVGWTFMTGNRTECPLLGASII